ncbi:MAG TPA: tetratricopeptide repeat protein [Magnetospirillaceae bacterium]|nr:tetratricopeptide repeat protein [Magnetospirillaceae bacterium]
MLTPRQALLVLPGEAALLNEAGTALTAADPAAALRWFDRAARLSPHQPEPWANLAGALLASARIDEAFDAARRALILAPGNAEGWNNLGNILFERRDYDRALAAFGRARRLHPLFADACLNEGGLRLDLGEAEEGAQLSRLAVAIAPDLPGAWNNLGNGLLLACRLAESETAFGHALTLAPDEAQIRFNSAAPLLKMGRYAEGWLAYEARRRTPAALIRRRSFAPPDWPGGDPEGKTLLLSTEQGYGDALQFCRYAVWMAEQGARVIVRTEKPLIRLLRGLAGIADVIAMDDTPPPFDFHLPLMSLPALYGKMPVTVPYLSADSAAVDGWRRRLSGLPGPRIGLAWSGNPRPGQRSAHLLDRRRSLTPAHFTDIAKIPHVTLVSLQKGGDSGDLPILDWTGDLSDFADSAALVAALDLIVSVDTAVAHLAGALGRPVCILSRFDGCWRWLQGRDDTPWYPSARLFRQPSPGDWRPPLEALHKYIVTL